MRTFSDSISGLQHLQFPIGETEARDFVYSDLNEISHLLVAGATGTGKSVFLHGTLLSLLAHNPPEELRFLLCDTKIVELSTYSSIPHLLAPVLSDPQKIADTLMWVNYEIHHRLVTMSAANVRNLQNYNDYAWENFLSDTGLPQIVVIIDDFTSVLTSVPDAANCLREILLNGRAVGVHLIATTQTPTWKTSRQISLLFRTKILFSASTAAESKLLIGSQAAASLPQSGEAIYSDGQHTHKVHTFFPSITDQASIFSAYSDHAPPDFLTNPPKDGQSEIACKNDSLEVDADLFRAAVDVVLELGQASVSMLQRRLKLGYSRAARLVDQMEEQGIVGPFDGSTPRAILITRAQWEMKDESIFQRDTSQENMPQQDNIPRVQDSDIGKIVLRRKEQILMRIYPIYIKVDGKPQGSLSNGEVLTLEATQRQHRLSLSLEGKSQKDLAVTFRHPSTPLRLLVEVDWHGRIAVYEDSSVPS